MPVSSQHQAAVTLWWSHTKCIKRPRKLSIMCDFLPLPLQGQQFTCGPRNLSSQEGWETGEPTEVCVQEKKALKSYIYLVFWGCLYFIHWFFPKQTGETKEARALAELSHSMLLFTVYTSSSQFRRSQGRKAHTAHFLSLKLTSPICSRMQIAVSCRAGRLQESYLQAQARLRILVQTHPVVLLPAEELLSPCWPQSLFLHL